MAVKAEAGMPIGWTSCYQSRRAGDLGAVGPPARTVRGGAGMGPKIAIIGGGIGGLTAAIALARKGLDAEVYEQAPVLEEVGAGVGLWPNAMTALAPSGLAGKVAQLAVKLAGEGGSGRGGGGAGGDPGGGGGRGR